MFVLRDKIEKCSSFPFINPNKLGVQPPKTINPSIDFIKKIQKDFPHLTGLIKEN